MKGKNRYDAVLYYNAPFVYTSVQRSIKEYNCYRCSKVIPKFTTYTRIQVTVGTYRPEDQEKYHMECIHD